LKSASFTFSPFNGVAAIQQDDVSGYEDRSEPRARGYHCTEHDASTDAEAQ
jgi:hypothetical protein